MTSSLRPCQIAECKQSSLALCYCCQQNLCRFHLIQHADAINDSLTPLADKINLLLDQLVSFDPPYLKQIETWRAEAHRTVDSFCNRHRQELIDDVREQQKNELDRLRQTLVELMKEQATTQDHVESLTKSIQKIEDKLAELQCLQLNIQPLMINTNLIDVATLQKNLFPLQPVHRTFSSASSGWFPLAKNENHLIFHDKYNFCLLDKNLSIVKNLPWMTSYTNEIIDICWSSTLAQFIAVASDQILTISDSTMIVQELQIFSKKTWRRVTCTDTTLFLTENGYGTSVYVYALLPKIQFIKKWQPPETCMENEILWDVQVHDKTLGVIRYSRQSTKRYVELCSSTTFERLWSVEIDGGEKCCPMRCGEWIVCDFLNKSLIHVSNDGKILKTISYYPTAFNTIQWNDELAILTKEGIKFHKL
ncbi:unnamed protein product [Rotaria sp. Silwood2]|nr:unnamed protein product [Rotaria sp. Silwood2]CAF2713311.1 unnamed protein product [Rotaria sp. Silwood2]CAF3432683.1 unnamed protein product [Rotaria sp. Silwood2]CAF4025754.1 unnamed protein product [Rotaria sp. Silwood2]CAF4179790.1 unnamed protein product [Rotaria sp. Silwood2]